MIAAMACRNNQLVRSATIEEELSRRNMFLGLRFGLPATKTAIRIAGL
jgi:hypothetical protein